MSADPPVLELRELGVSYPDSPGGEVQAVRGLSLCLRAGEILGIAGESGSGKSQTALALLGLLGPGARRRGQILLQGQRLDGLDERGWQGVRGRHIGLVSQDPSQALNPYLTVGSQLREVLRVHRGLDAREAAGPIVRMLAAVGLDTQPGLLAQYPHQLSGGMQQRVTLAMALLPGPALVVADEPTTALDVTTQSQVLALLARLARETGTAILLISHDLASLAGVADRLLVMYGGRAMETGAPGQVFARPRHPYTRGLLACMPRLDSRPGQPLAAMPGQAPARGQWPAGCPFHPRCPRRLERCAGDMPALQPDGPDAGADRCLACFNPEPGP